MVEPSAEFATLDHIRDYAYSFGSDDVGSSVTRAVEKPVPETEMVDQDGFETFSEIIRNILYLMHHASFIN